MIRTTARRRARAENGLRKPADWIIKEVFSEETSWVKKGREACSGQREQHVQKLGGECTAKNRKSRPWLQSAGIGLVSTAKLVEHELIERQHQTSHSGQDGARQKQDPSIIMSHHRQKQE